MGRSLPGLRMFSTVTNPSFKRAKDSIVGVYTRSPRAAQEVLARHEHADPHVNGGIRVAVGNVLVEDGKHGLEDPNRPKKNSYRRLGAIGASVVLLAGLIVLGIGVADATGGPKTDSTATGTITGVGQREYSSSSSSSRRSSSRTDRGCRASASFQVDGVEHQASSHGPDGDLCWLTVGDDIKVHYEAANPSANYIGDRPGKGAIWPIGIGLTMIAFSGLLVAARLNSMRLGSRLVNEGSKMMRLHPDPGTGAPYAKAAATEMTLVLRGMSAEEAENAHRAPLAPPVAQVAPGWYATADGAHERWHDGIAWTDTTRPTGVS